MAKKKITPDNIGEILACTGFIFPRNEMELIRFEKLTEGEDEDVTGEEIDIDLIISGETRTTIVEIKLPEDDSIVDLSRLKMVARNGKDLPAHILKKMKDNQDAGNSKNKGSQEA